MSEDDPLESLRRITESISNGSLADITRHQKDLRRVQESMRPALAMAEQLRSSGALSEMARVTASINQNKELFEAARRTTENGALTQLAARIAAENQALTQLARARSAAEESLRAVSPKVSELRAIAEILADQVKPFDLAMARAQQSWASTLAIRMKEIHNPWLLHGFESVSLTGFARLTKLNEVLRYGTPFEHATREIVDDDLGSPIDVEDDTEPEARDVASIEAGFALELISFPSAAYHEVLVEAGFSLRAEYGPLPDVEDGSDPGLIFDPGHFALVTAVESRLRTLIVTQLHSAYGDAWLKQKVNEDVRVRWQKRKEEAIDAGEAPLDLIYYADLMDLKDIIVRRDNWDNFFKNIFVRKEHFIVSMERLHPIRRPLAHSRPIGRAQALVLMAEAAQILKALGKSVLQ